VLRVRVRVGIGARVPRLVEHAWSQPLQLLHGALRDFSTSDSFALCAWCASVTPLASGPCTVVSASAAAQAERHTAMHACVLPEGRERGCTCAGWALPSCACAEPQPGQVVDGGMGGQRGMPAQHALGLALHAGRCSQLILGSLPLQTEACGQEIAARSCLQSRRGAEHAGLATCASRPSLLPPQNLASLDIHAARKSSQGHWASV